MGLGEITKEMKYIKITYRSGGDRGKLEKKSRRKYILIYFYSLSFY